MVMVPVASSSSTASARTDPSWKAFRGPRFGRAGLRDLVGVHDRPLLATALKPLRLGPQELGNLAFALAQGGINLIKDDHGLADQPFCRFEARVGAVTASVTYGSAATGRRCLYAPNVTASPATALQRARFAKSVGARALLVAPGLCGWDTVRALADDDALALPIVLHPALLGTLQVGPSHGIAPPAGPRARAPQRVVLVRRRLARRGVRLGRELAIRRVGWRCPHARACGPRPPPYADSARVAGAARMGEVARPAAGGAAPGAPGRFRGRCDRCRQHHAPPDSTQRS